MTGNILTDFFLKIGAIITGLWFFFYKARKIGQQDIINKTEEEVLENVRKSRDIKHKIDDLNRVNHINLLQTTEKDDN